MPDHFSAALAAVLVIVVMIAAIAASSRSVRKRTVMVIVGGTSSRAVVRTMVVRRLAPSGLGEQWQDDGEGGALAEFAGDRHGAVHAVHQRFDDRETESSAAVMARDGGRELRVRHEQTRFERVGNA